MDASGRTGVVVVRGRQAQRVAQRLFVLAQPGDPHAGGGRRKRLSGLKRADDGRRDGLGPHHDVERGEAGAGSEGGHVCESCHAVGRQSRPFRAKSIP